jgi:hypothetical protein
MRPITNGESALSQLGYSEVWVEQGLITPEEATGELDILTASADNPPFFGHTEGRGLAGSSASSRPRPSVQAGSGSC